MEMWKKRGASASAAFRIALITDAFAPQQLLVKR